MRVTPYSPPACVPCEGVSCLEEAEHLVSVPAEPRVRPYCLCTWHALAIRDCLQPHRNRVGLVVLERLPANA